jgi:hypothetical protein
MKAAKCITNRGYINLFINSFLSLSLNSNQSPSSLKTKSRLPEVSPALTRAVSSFEK